MNKDSKIFVAGHRGLVGSAILKNLKAKGYTNFVLRTHAELDLTDQLCGREAGICVSVGRPCRRDYGEQPLSG